MVVFYNGLCSVLLCSKEMLLGRLFWMHPSILRENFEMDMGKVLIIVVCSAAPRCGIFFAAAVELLGGRENNYGKKKTHEYLCK